MSELPSGTVTLLFTDIEGSTRLLEQLGPEYEAVLAEHRRLIREAVGARGGHEVDTQGDAFFCAFASARAAVEAAGEAQRALATTPVRVRMGLHTGEPTRGEEGYVGIDLHRGARVMAAGHGGQVLLSEATRALLDTELPLTDLGEHRLKDLAAPVRLYQLGSEDFPALRTLENRPHNLPAFATPLVGRERELAELAELLADERLLTLTGPGGSGKTRLALQLAADELERFREGVYLVQLALVSDPELVPATVAQTLGLREQAEEPPAATLTRYLAGKELLLVLDNLEQVIGCAPELGELLAACPELRILATSRECLRLSSEHEYAVPPLPGDDAIALFCERAGLVEPDATVAEICRRLDNLPLALELAAARVKLLPPPKLLERLELKLLAGGARDAPERQRTLRATIEWSYELLSPEEQRLFRGLAVFPGGATLEAAETVCEAELETLASLLDKSLVRQAEDPDGEPRFRMLETVREYAGERLEASGAADETRRRQAEYLLALAEQADEGLRTPEQRAWVERLRAEQDNLRAALAFARGSGEAELEVKLCAALGYFWYWTTAVREVADVFASALVKSETVSDRDRARLLYGAGLVTTERGDWDRSLALSQDAREIFQRGDDPRAAIECLWTINVAFGGLGDVDEEFRAAEQAVDEARALGDPYVLAGSLNNLAWSELKAGRDLSRARDLAGESVVRAREAGHVHLVGFALHTAGGIAAGLGLHAEAARLLRESLSLVGEAGFLEAVCEVLVSLAELEAERGDATKAARLVGAATRIRREAGFVSTQLEAADRVAQAARERLDGDAFDAAWQEGAAMTLAEIVGYATQGG